MHDRTTRSRSRPVRAWGAALAIAGGALFACEGPAHDDWPAPAAGRAAPAAVGGSRPERAPGAPRVALAPEHAGPDALKLFVKNCAACHGTDGSGQGPSVLDRPARNFKDGGFSFGNTSDAIFNTISYGIPGTPMPAFGEALDERERHLLATYVRTLCPSVADVAQAETIMTVKDTPVIVRGILPPIVEGAPLRPRGLLIGLPGAADNTAGGLSFEYRIDDVRLLGVRQGNFVERTDWNGRGGTPLRPLGGLIWTDSGGDPGSTFTLGSRTDLVRRLTESGGARLESELVVDGQRVALVEERLEAIRRGALHGFRQALHIARQPSQPLHLWIARPAPAQLVASIEAQDDADQPTWRIYERSDGVYECVGIRLEESVGGIRPLLFEPDQRLYVAILPVVGSVTITLGGPRVVIDRLFSTEWSETIRRLLLEPEH